MTEQGKYFVEEFKKGNVMLESMQTLYEKGHITKEEYTDAVGKEPKEKQIDICEENRPKTNEELTEEQIKIQKIIADLEIESIINN